MPISVWEVDFVSETWNSKALSELRCPAPLITRVLSSLDQDLQAQHITIDSQDQLHLYGDIVATQRTDLSADTNLYLQSASQPLTGQVQLNSGQELYLNRPVNAQRVVARAEAKAEAPARLYISAPIQATEGIELQGETNLVC